MVRIATVFLVSVLLLQTAGAQTAADPFMAAIEGPQTGRTGDLVELPLAAAMQKAGVPGLSIAVIRDFEIHWSKGYGLADVVSGDKVTADTLFQVVSVGAGL